MTKKKHCKIKPLGCLSIIIIVIVCIKCSLYILDKYNILQQEVKNEALPKSSKSEVVTNPDTNNYKTVLKKKSDINTGELILVNNQTPYSFDNNDNNDLVSVLDVKNSAYKVKNKDVLLNKNITQPLSDMLKDFNDKYNNNSVIILSGHRTFDYQKQLYSDRTDRDGKAEAMKWVANPGGSEHHTGLALDFGIFGDNRLSKDYKGQGDFKWINQNAYKYGFIVRYAESKSKLTGINYEPWHFRYIGIPHSFAMSQTDMCFEEYIDFLRQFDFNKKHLKITSFDKKQYEIYFTKDLEVPVPKEKEYSISGNNVDGFIVTVSL